MNYALTAAHLFKMSEKMSQPVAKILAESGATGYPEDEINKIAAVLTDNQITEIVQRLMRSANHYNNQAQAAEKAPSDFIYPPHKYIEMCRSISHCAALWAITKAQME